MADKMSPEEATRMIGQQLTRTKSGLLAEKRLTGQPILDVFGVKKAYPLENQTNYYNTLKGSLGEQATGELLPSELAKTPEGQPFVNRDAYDQVMQASAKVKDSRMLSPEESALTIAYWKQAAPSLVPLAETIVQKHGGIPEWLGKQGPSYRTKRSEYSSVQGFTEDSKPVEYDQTERKWFVGGKETPADQIGRLISKTRPQMTDGQVTDVTNLLNAQGQLQQVQNLFDPEATGPVQDKLLAFQEYTGIKMPDLQGLSALSDDKVKLRTVLGSAINDYIKAITGAQMSEPEARRIMKALPKPGSADEAFLPALQEVMKITKMKLDTRLDVLETQDTVGVKKLRELATQRAMESTPSSRVKKQAGVSKVSSKFGF